MRGVVHVAKIALSQSHVPALHNVEVSERGGRLVLNGRVRTYYQKQLAQGAVRTALTQLHIVNEIMVAGRRHGKR